MSDTGTRGWDADRIERARTMYLAGKTATEIAEELGGLTRSAVCGKLYRLGISRAGPSAPTARMLARLSGRPANPPRRPKAVKPVATMREPGEARQTSGRGNVEVLSPNPLTMLELPLTGACRWIVDTDNALSCGNSCGKATYCSGHHRIAYDRSHPRYGAAQVNWIVERIERQRQSVDEKPEGKPWNYAPGARRA